MISYLGSLVQSCCGEGGALQTDIAVCGGHSPCSGHTGFARYRGVCAFSVYTAQAPGCSIWSGPCVECSSSFRVLQNSADLVAPACCVFPASAVQAAKGLGALLRARGAFSLRGEQLRQPEACAHSPQVRHAFSLSGTSARRRSGLRSL